MRMRTTFSVVLVALLTTACGVDLPPTAPSTIAPHGTAAKIEVTATPGVGSQGGTATVTARVVDAYSAAIANAAVTFAADAGTFTEATLTTDQNGTAAGELHAAPGLVKVIVSSGSLRAPETPVVVQPVTGIVGSPAPNPPPPPAPAPRPPPPSVPPQLFPPAYTVSIAASPTSVVVGTPTTLTATATPINGAPAVASWTWDCDTATTATDATTPLTSMCTYPLAGTFTASVKVTGPGGSPTTSATTAVTVTVAPVPSYTVTLTASPATIAAGASTTLTANVTRVNGATPPTTWTWDCDTTAPTVDSRSAITATCTYPLAGIYIATVTASNGGSVSGTATVDVNVTAAAPAPMLVAITPAAVAPATGLGAIHIGDSVDFTATATSTLAPAAVTWEWDDNNDGTFETLPTTPAAALTNTRRVVMLVTGVWKVRVRVTDPATGRTASATSQVTVQ